MSTHKDVHTQNIVTRQKSSKDNADLMHALLNHHNTEPSDEDDFNDEINTERKPIEVVQRSTYHSKMDSDRENSNIRMENYDDYQDGRDSDLKRVETNKTSQKLRESMDKTFIALAKAENNSALLTEQGSGSGQGTNHQSTILNLARLKHQSTPEK